MKKINYFFISLFVYLLIATSAWAGPQSSTYEIKNYGFSTGGANGVTSTTYSVFGDTGQTSSTTLNSTTYALGAGLTYLLKTNVPPAPTISTPANNYDRIKFIINTGNNPSDTTFALQISTTSNFSSGNNYIKSDGTIGPTLSSLDYKTYTNWGGSSGNFVTGLTQNTTYYIRIKAKQGNFTETEFGPAASITTATSSLSFSVDTNTLTFTNLNAGNAYTDSSKMNILTTSTNAYNGYIIYGRVTQPLTFGPNTIANYTSPNSTPTTWSGTGFGYTTSDSNLTGTGGTNRFASATKYAGFGTVGPGDPVADNAGPVATAPISNEAFTLSYRVTGTSTLPAGTYQNTILYTIIPSY